jgi:hypothetical protein
MEDYKRKKGKDKRKETFKKYGKNTSRGLRHKLEQCQANLKDMFNNQSDSKTKSSRGS